MRLLAAALTFVAIVGCASQAQPRRLAVEVYEHRGTVHSVSVEGQHIFRVRVMNQSEDAVWIDAISLRPQTTSLSFTDADQIVHEILEPGETRDLAMWINVRAVPMSYIYSIDTLDVSITAHTPERGSFTETGAHTVVAE